MSSYKNLVLGKQKNSLVEVLKKLSEKNTNEVEKFRNISERMTKQA